ncbi:MAG TPA: GMC family oxidoreductase [Usitatibacter sp.]|jgi:gluconate 2-dehydrogenase alpha chain|nr:GMC family oxidoreductase [Usitatibacter sp.]
MARKLKEVDCVMCGFGMVGAILSRELLKAGVEIVALERGEPRSTVPDFQGPAMHDELRYSVRKALMMDAAKETFTFRNQASETALPIRRLQGFLPGTGVGGSMVHWNGQTYRFPDFELRMRTMASQRYGADFLGPEYTFQDWGVSAGDMEPYYDRFEYLLGVAGKAGNIKGEKVEGGNPFEDPRAREYPTKPMKEPYGSQVFRKAAASLGYHPFPQPSSNMSEPYTNPEGVRLETCMFCGFCERYGCEHYAKSSPQTILLPVILGARGFTLKTGCRVLRVNLDSGGKRAVSVTYADASGEEIEQPAKLVIIGMFALNNVHLALLSRIGTPYDPRTGHGVTGRNYCYQTTAGVNVFYGPDHHVNPFMRSGANGTVIADFVGGNFDHSRAGFLGGAYIGEIMTNGRPIEFHPTPPGTPSWGAEWKRAVVAHYAHTSNLNVSGSSIAVRQNYLDLDPTYRNTWGQPLLRMTFDFPDNDIKLSAFCTAKAVEIGKAMGGQQVTGSPRKKPYTTTVYQSTHNTGGTVMGSDPSVSLVNPWLQVWDVHNVFIIGASNFQQNAAYNPTGTVGALAYRAADALVNRYLKNPGPLVSA